MRALKYILGSFFCLAGIVMMMQICLQAESLLPDLVPDDEDIAGWSRDGETAIATDLDSLSGLINGAAPFYIERGAVEVLFQDYMKDDVFLTLEIYRTDTQEQAKRLYTEIQVENPEALKNVGTEGRLVSGLIGAYLLEYRQKSFFVRLTIADKSQQSKEAIINFAKSISEKIQKMKANP